MSRLILASASPQRKTLLEGLGMPFEIIVSDVQEDDHPESDPLQRSKDLARLKAQDIAKKNAGAFVIGCDTLVVAHDGTLLEKPKTPTEAKKMLQLHSGAVSIVHSAVCIVDAQGRLHEEVSSSAVMFKTLTSEEIDWWVSTNLWRDRSGGFQIDGQGQLLIASIIGDWTGIVGLPVFLLGRLLEDAGCKIR